MMLNNTPQILGLTLITLSTTVQAAPAESCSGDFFSYKQQSTTDTLPTIKINAQGLLQLNAGEVLTLSTEFTASGEPSFVWCAPLGNLVKSGSILNTVNYQAPTHILEDQVVPIGVQIDDNGRVEGDTILVFLRKSTAGHIIVGTDKSRVLVYTPQATLSTTIPVSTSAAIIATKDIDNDGTEEIAVQNDATYEVTGDKTDVAVTSDMFVIKADVKGDIAAETITGSQTKNEVSISGQIITVFNPTDVIQARKGNKKDWVTLCHKGKTQEYPESAVPGHLGHGDTHGACSSSPPSNNGNKKVTICHNDEQTGKKQTITISENALDTHLKNHSDTLGACSGAIGHAGVNIAVADFNQDGKMDIVAAMANKGGGIEVITGDGTKLGGFTAFSNDTGVIISAGNILGDETPEIIAAPIGSSEITIFDLQGTVLKSFTIDGTVTSLAIPQQPKLLIDKDTEDSEDTETLVVISAPTCPSSGSITTITSTCIGNNAELPKDIAISEGVSVANVQLDSTDKIDGIVGNSTIKEGAVVEGGTFTGNMTNKGTLKNAHFTGYLLKGGTLAGIINVEFNGSRGLRLGHIQDVELAADAIIIGGVLSGEIKGNSDKPALILNALIKKGTKLSHVHLGADVKMEEGVEELKGVKHVSTTFENLNN